MNIKTSILIFSSLIFISINVFSQKTNKPVAGDPWNVLLTGGSNLPMVWIPHGKFVMGSPSGEQGRKAEEIQHEVTLTKGFWLGKTEVTIGQWRAVMGESLRDHVIKMLKDETVYDFNGRKQKLREYMYFDPNDPDKIMENEDDTLPMYFVSWFDAIDFCHKLTTLERKANRIPKGFEYGLPTEAQWEYACRAGTVTATYDVVDSICWYSGNSSIGYEGKKTGNASAGPRKAGERLPNAWGLFDMSGNLWEWCANWYGAYTLVPVKDASGPESGAAKVNRGGSWGSGCCGQSQN